MFTHYNRIAGQSVERLAAISDGIFAVAMTLLLLNVRLPSPASIHSEHDLWLGLVAVAPRLVVSFLSFLTLGMFWVGQQTQLNYLTRGSRDLAWIHLMFLFAVTLIPFSTILMAQFITYRLALLVYWGNIALIGALLFATWRYSVRAGLVKAEDLAEISRGIERRIVIAGALYAFGALLCVFNTYWSIGFSILIQLNYVIAPRLGILSRF